MSDNQANVAAIASSVTICVVILSILITVMIKERRKSVNAQNIAIAKAARAERALKDAITGALQNSSMSNEKGQHSQQNVNPIMMDTWVAFFTSIKSLSPRSAYNYALIFCTTKIDPMAASSLKEETLTKMGITPKDVDAVMRRIAGEEQEEKSVSLETIPDSPAWWYHPIAGIAKGLNQLVFGIEPV